MEAFSANMLIGVLARPATPLNIRGRPPPLPTNPLGATSARNRRRPPCVSTVASSSSIDPAIRNLQCNIDA